MHKVAKKENGAKVTFATEPDRRGKGPKAVDLKVVGV